MIHGFEAWSAGRCQTNSFSDLDGSTIGIDASFYLDRFLNQAPFKEPLVSALGGLPFALRTHIENELQTFTNHRITPLFVFHGLDVGRTFRPFKSSDDAAKTNAEAWRLYNEHHAEKAVETFGNSGVCRSSLAASSPLS